MATAKDKITVYVPADEGVLFRALVDAEDKTITAVLRRMIRDYIATARERAAA